MKFIPVDVIGRCGKNIFSKMGKNETFYNYLEDHYKFYFAFENSLCADYITEKFYMSLK